MKKQQSYRHTVFITSGFILFLFVVLLFLIFQVSISGILLNSETNYFLDQTKIINGMLTTIDHKTELIAGDIAYWDETIKFLQGDNEGFVEKNWSSGSLLNSYRYNFVYFKDLNGKNWFSDFLDYANDTPLQEPPGLSEKIDQIAEAVLVNAVFDDTLSSNVEDYVFSGVFLLDEVPYYMSVAPVWLPDQGISPAGTVTIGSILSDEYYTELLHLNNFFFSYIQTNESVLPTADDGMTLVRAGDSISAVSYHKGIDGTELMLSIRTDRDGYNEGRQVMNITFISIIILSMLSVALLYSSVSKRVFRPLEQLSEDIGEVSNVGGIDVNKYSRSKEYTTLCNSINDMLLRLNQSRISVDVFRRILNSLNAMIYVSDIETDELLFVNDMLLKNFNLKEFCLGKPCWMQLQLGMKGRCPFCVVPELLVNKDIAVTWEEKNTLTGRYYLNTDCLIPWYNDKLAHLHHRVDITDNKNAEESLEYRLKQQEIMSDIAQQFIKTQDLAAFIQYVLQVSGEFLSAGRVLLTQANPETNLVELKYEWHNKDQGLNPIGNRFSPYSEGHPIYDALVRDGRKSIIANDIHRYPKLTSMRNDGVKSFIALPILANGSLWGILNVAMLREYRDWTESDEYLFALIANIISAVVERNLSEGKLVLMSSIVESSPNYIAHILETGQFVYINLGVERFSGYTRDELLQGGISLLLDHDAQKALLERYIPEAIRLGRLDCVLQIIRKDGTRRMLSISLFAIDNHQSGLGIIGIDITKQVELQQDLLDAKEQAEKSSQAKGDFLSRMSHEMRTPMNAIIGMAHIAKTTEDANRKEYCLDKIDEASTHLLGVINDVLDMSKIEANKFALSLAPFHFEKMLQKVASIINFRMEEKRLQFRMVVDPSTPKVIVSDEQRLAQVITNLLSNAVKFTPVDGTVSLYARSIHMRDSHCRLQIEVEDSGIGIPKEQQNKLFRSFEQVDGGISRRFGGTGLGLAISKSIVEMMNGRIWVESSEGKGARFIFTLEAACPDDQKQLARDTLSVSEAGEEQRAKGAYTGLHMLLAEDVDINREIAESLLEDTGIAIDEAENGVVAFEKFKANPSLYDIIFMDIHMPMMDGYEATRRIRALNAPEAKTVPVVAMTANVFREDIERCLQAGMNDHIGKPFDVEEFFAKLRKNLRNSGVKGRRE